MQHFHVRFRQAAGQVNDTGTGLKLISAVRDRRVDFDFIVVVASDLIF